jgi:cell division protein FtsQ
MPTIAAPADKRFRRAHVKPGRKQKVNLRHMWLGVKVATILGLAVYGGWRAASLLLSAQSLQVSRVLVRGNERLSTGEIHALVDGLEGQNTLTVDLDRWQQRLLASPWVEDATVRRLLPSRIHIQIRERRPMGIGRIGTALYLVDSRGIVIDEYGPNYADLDLLLVDGLAARPGDDPGAVDEDRARLAARLITALQARPDMAQKVAQIDVSDAHDAVVLLENDPAMLRLGESDFVERLQNYFDLAPALRERVANIDYVDLRFDQRLYVRPAAPSKR